MAEQSALRQYEYGGEGLFGFLMPVRREILSPEQRLDQGYTSTRRGIAVDSIPVPAKLGEPERDPTYSPLYRGLKSALHFLYDIGNNREQATETVQTALRGIDQYAKDQYTAAALGGTAYNPETGGVTEFDPTIAMVGGAPAGVQALRAATPGSVVLGMVGSKNARLTPQTGDLDMSHAARMQRAVEGDWNPDRPVYHWTEAPDIEEFIPSTEGKLGAGVYASPIPSYGERYVDQSKAIAMPLNYRGQLAGIQDFDDAYNVARSEMPNLTGSEAVRAWRARANDVLAERGFTGREVGGEVLIFDPKNIRSTSAAFDPAQRGSSNILASGSKLGTGVAVVSGFSKMNRYDLDETLSAVRESWPFSYDISWEELMTPESLKELPGNVKNLVKALWKEDGLGFDNPAQAISTVLSEDAGNYDITPQLKSAVTKLIRSPADIQPPAPLIPGQQRQAVEEISSRLLKGTFGRTLDTSNIQTPFSTVDRNAIGMTTKMLDPQTAPVLQIRPDYFKTEKDLDYQILNMSPDEYLNRAFEILSRSGNATPAEIIAQRAGNPEYIQSMAESMLDGNVYAAPYLDYKGQGQEGIHRALAAKQLGVDEIPVMVFDSYSNPSAPQDLTKSSLRAIISPTETGFDPSYEGRVGELRKISDTQFRYQGEPPTPKEISIFDLEGRPFVTSMSDRSMAGTALAGIGDVNFDIPVDLLGGQGYMFGNPGELWAAAKTPASSIYRTGELAGALGGVTTPPLYLPYRMGATGSDFSHMTTDAMLTYARNNMSASTIKQANKDIKEILPDWKGIENPESMTQLSNVADSTRAKVRNLLDKKYRDEGGIGVGTARLAISDPNQYQAITGGLQNVGEFDLSSGIAPSRHRSYPYAIPGQGIGTLKEKDINVYELMPELAAYRGIDVTKPIPQSEMYTLQTGIKGAPGQIDPTGKARPFSGIITESALRAIENRRR